MKNGVKNIQTTGYNGVRTIFEQDFCRFRKQKCPIISGQNLEFPAIVKCAKKNELVIQGLAIASEKLFLFFVFVVFS